METENLMGKRIRAKRIEKELTMEQLGTLVGVQSSAVNKWEKGFVKNIKRSTIAELAKVLDCNPVWLMGIDTDNNNFKNGVADAELMLKIKKLPAEGRKELESYLEFLLSKYGA